MKIKVGHKYKTRDGKMAFVFNCDQEDFYVCALGVPDVYYVNSRGLEFIGRESELDLVAPWPKKVKETTLKKPVYQWAYWACAEGNWRTEQKLLTKEQATREYVNTEAYRIHAGPFEGSEP